MPTQEVITDSPTGWVASHIKRYVDSDGADGHQYYGLNTLLITTRGRKTGILRRTALIYGQDGDRYIVVASNGGSPHHPNWYLNLKANPEVQVQVGADHFTARARTATPEERPALWTMMSEIFPTYRDYQNKTEREIPVVILERV